MKIYNFLLLLFVAATPHILNAQINTNVGLKGGIALPFSGGDAGENVRTLKMNEYYRVGGYWAVGAEINYRLNEKSSVYSGLYYRNMRYKYNVLDFGTLKGENVFGEVSFSPNFGGVEIPIAYRRQLTSKFSLDLGFVVAYNNLISYSFSGNTPHFSDEMTNDTLNYHIYREEVWPSFLTFELLYGISYKLSPKFTLAFLMQNGLNKTEKMDYQIDINYEDESIKYHPVFEPKIKLVYFKLNYLLSNNKTN